MGYKKGSFAAGKIMFDRSVNSGCFVSCCPVYCGSTPFTEFDRGCCATPPRRLESYEPFGDVIPDVNAGVICAQDSGYDVTAL